MSLIILILKGALFSQTSPFFLTPTNVITPPQHIIFHLYLSCFQVDDQE